MRSRPHSVFSDPIPVFQKTVFAISLLLVVLCGSATAFGQTPETVASIGHHDPIASEAPTHSSAPATAPVTVHPVAASTAKLKIPPKYDLDRIGERGIGKGLNFFSLKRERALGQAMAGDLDTQLHLVRDPDLNAYVNHVVQNLVFHSDAQIPFTVKIVQNDEVNAFSLPGGFLYVNTGLIASAPDEATFAGILAHEVAHVAARHATKALTRRMLFRMAYVPMMFITGGAAIAINNAAGVVMPMSNMKFSRDSEREADLLGLEYMYAAGYDPGAFVQFFETVQSHQRPKHKMPKILGLMFNSQPATTDRIKRAQAVITTMLPEKSDYILDTSAFQAAKDRLSEVIHLPCTDAHGRPILLGAGQRCEDKSGTKKPTLRGTLHPAPTVTP
ncbi:MAG: M48 family metalloprotease [Terriglobia bacterium]|nr:M48 family metalloprotease [Terriglobia bacterium]